MSELLNILLQGKGDGGPLVISLFDVVLIAVPLLPPIPHSPPFSPTPLGPPLRPEVCISAFVLDKVVAEAASTVDEVVAEDASTADEVVA